ncbi:bla regulator protein BlaR1 [Paenibacillus sp. V4I3]|uniref:M56 family metallopeptidase n=1 Tax=Paenibacillus sp. V4I3 TaxID=3042305 RepID=UPI00278A98B7|nr:M56 family metallopeptidase [Paenibacillus sp. V4I3]MDQ0873409.1 bla regulator protein BlaR1 [Paenibacillus sp. V4I3]
MNVKRLTEHLIDLFDWVWSVSTMASVLVVLIIVMQQVLRHRLKPRWHYLMWLLVIVRLILPWGPESEFSIYNWIGYTDAVHSAVQVSQEEILTRAVVSETAAYSVYRNLVVVWLVGVCFLGIYTIRINRKFARKMKNETVAITDERVLGPFNQCKKMMSINKTIALVESCNLATPTLFGLAKPQLIMPKTILNSLNDDQLQHVYLHELAHSKRNDIGVNWFMHALLIIHWFNPILWYAYRRMREDQEIASDALALSCLTPDKSQDYGYTLIKLLENFSRPVQAVGNVNLTGSKIQLQRRIKMIKQFKTNSYRWSFLGIATIIFISGCALTNPKDSSTSTPLQSTAVTEEKVKQQDSVDSNVTASEETTKVAVSVVPQTTPSDEKSRPAASVGVQSTVSDDKPRAAPVSPGPRVLDDKPRAVPVSPEPRVLDDKPRAVPVSPEPRVLDDKPRVASPLSPRPTAAAAD